MDKVIEWLLSGDPWVEYCTRKHLLDRPDTDEEVAAAKRRTISHPRLRSVISEFSGWSGEIVSSHKNAGLLLHKLSFLADIGLTMEDPGIKDIVNMIAENRTENGVVLVPVNIPTHFGGTGRDTWGWCLCDAPAILYSLAKFGLRDEPFVKSAARFFVSLCRDNGWGCNVSQELGKFRGPGRKDDPCPYATLLMLKLLAQLPDLASCGECRAGAESLLQLWTCSMERHPYMFYMGTDFRKLKAPLVWYDIVHVADVLSQFEWLRNDPRLGEMISCVKSQADENGRFTPQSEWKAWKGWDFGQKKEPSRWLTFVVLRILKRLEDAGCRS